MPMAAMSPELPQCAAVARRLGVQRYSRQNVYDNFRKKSNNDIAAPLFRSDNSFFVDSRAGIIFIVLSAVFFPTMEE